MRTSVDLSDPLIQYPANAWTEEDDRPIERPRPFGSVGWILLIYGVSFFLPVERTVVGFSYFLMGAVYSVTVVCLPITFPWLANIFLWVGVRQLWNRRHGWAAVHGLIATFLAAAWSLNVPEFGVLGPGYWTWLGSMVLLLIFALGHHAADPAEIRSYTYHEILGDLEPRDFAHSPRRDVAGTEPQVTRGTSIGIRRHTRV